jgi:Plasmid pRiA4b ORF-3-like protein
LLDKNAPISITQEIMAKTKKSETVSKKVVNSSANGLYVLDVFLIDGPITSEFIADNPEVSRTIEIKGSNTLEELHKIIFKAFDREEEHMYEFQVGGNGPQDPNAIRYGLKQAFSSSGLTLTPTGDVSSTSIAEVGLSIDEAFGYWFDFGDDWWHQINVTNILDKAPTGKYPRITKRLGASPPQYADFE